MLVGPEAYIDERVLPRIDAMIEADPESISLRFARATALHDLCRNPEAERAYLEVLARDPAHFGALTNLGTLLHIQGRGDVARAFYAKAVVEHPDEPIAYINLGNAFAEDGDTDRAIEAYERALAVSPGNSNAHFALSLLYQQLGRHEEALRARQLAFARPIISVAPALNTQHSIDVLLLISADGGNVVHAPLIDRNNVRLYSLVVEGYSPQMYMPTHHVVFNAIGDADRAAAALERVPEIVARSGAPVINPPDRVLATRRTDIATRLAEIPHVRTARTIAVPRAELTPERIAAEGLSFPVLLRTPGYHTGAHFAAANSPDELATVVADLPGRELLAIEFLDGRGEDGFFRKLRVLFIDGKIYPLHLAASPDWKVHYFSAGMGERPQHRLEEALFLYDMPAQMGRKVMTALEAIRDELGLDYGGVDFGIQAGTGDVIVYEANATMVVLPPPPDPRFEYRRPANTAAIEAARELIRSRALAGGYPADA